MTFEGVIHDKIPEDWNERTRDNPFMNADLLTILKLSSSVEFKLVTHPLYCCTEYELRMNLLAFSRFYLPAKITVIGIPVSICKSGYVGSIDALIQDYKKRKGIFLVLNNDAPFDNKEYSTGKTLPTCVFYNQYENFTQYLNALRSSYRRRLRAALKKGAGLTVKSIKNNDFTPEMYALYSNVAARSKYPLETLNINFFRLFEGEIICLFEENTPVAFVILKSSGDTLYFVFGGMDYDKRDEYDLYYNMLLVIIKSGIDGKFRKIDFGQTAERSKMRVGCQCQSKYMLIFSANKIIDFMLKHLVGIFEYRFKGENLKAFKNS